MPGEERGKIELSSEVVTPQPAIGAGTMLTPDPAARHLAARTGCRSTITQIYEGTNQIQRVVMARQLLK
jgi:alkylation response protein AidB-like acyl-CoA dehydrogenase